MNKFLKSMYLILLFLGLTVFLFSCKKNDKPSKDINDPNKLAKLEIVDKEYIKAKRVKPSEFEDEFDFSKLYKGTLIEISIKYENLKGKVVDKLLVNGYDVSENIRKHDLTLRKYILSIKEDTKVSVVLKDKPKEDLKKYKASISEMELYYKDGDISQGVYKSSKYLEFMDGYLSGSLVDAYTTIRLKIKNLENDKKIVGIYKNISGEKIDYSYEYNTITFNITSDCEFYIQVVSKNKYKLNLPDKVKLLDPDPTNPSLGGNSSQTEFTDILEDTKLKLKVEIPDGKKVQSLLINDEERKQEIDKDGIIYYSVVRDTKINLQYDNLKYKLEVVESSLSYFDFEDGYKSGKEVDYGYTVIFSIKNIPNKPDNTPYDYYLEVDGDKYDKDPDGKYRIELKKNRKVKIILKG